MPEPGDELIGIFRGWSSGVTRRAETHPIALVEDDRGITWAVWCFFKVLRAELEKENPKTGEFVLIRRLPDRESENGPYRVFRVVVDRAEPDPFGESDPPVDADAPGDWKLASGTGDSPDNTSCDDQRAASGRGVPR